MGRAREQSFFEDVFDLLKLAPAWVGPLLAVVVFVLLRAINPLFVRAPKPDDIDTGLLLRPILALFAWVVPGIVLLAWVGAELWKLSNRRMLDRQTGIGTVRDLSWPEFERLVCEAYRRQGYVAEVTGRASGDGGVDVELTRRGERVVVQCKQWKAWKVGVAPVRELLGVVVHRNATRGVLVTSGRFTQEAMRFAAANPRVELVDGPTLARMIDDVRCVAHALPVASPMSTPSSPTPVSPTCPSCGATMVVREARRGKNAGSRFWGCPRYPACRGTREYASA